MVVALFIVALVATISYAMLSRLERDTRRVTLLTRNTQAELYAQGSIAWAMDQLRNDWLNQKPGKMVDLIPIVSPVNMVNGYSVKSSIYDMQGRFNINNLSNPEMQTDFARLLHALAPKLSDAEVLSITLAIYHWISPSQTEDELNRYYAELPVPYRPAHRPMTSVSELRLVKGMTPSLYAALKPYVTALPRSVSINIQTVTAPVLMTLSQTMTLDAAKAIVELRKMKPFITVEDFLNLDIVKNHQIKTDKITTVSQYFLVETDVAIENQHLLLYTLLERVNMGGDGKAAVNVLWQSKGTW